jgi:hypothetical protein
LDLAFFGLTSEIASQYRASLFTQIHEIVFHGQGGYNWETVYNMPIWLRKFTFNKMREHYEKQNASQNEDLGTQSQKIKDLEIEILSLNDTMCWQDDKIKELEEENRKLKHMYADLALDNKMLKDVLSKKW